MVTEYKRQLLNGGIKALLTKIEILEKIEDYEGCHEIIKAISEHNLSFNDTLPTRLGRELHMSF